MYVLTKLVHFCIRSQWVDGFNVVIMQLDLQS